MLDLSNPADPQQAGELQMPGYSDYLFPLDNGLLLGVGRDADANGRMGGVKVALLDVANPSCRRRWTRRRWAGRAAGPPWTAAATASTCSRGAAACAWPCRRC
ncbi:MAG: beta-propeller domain-containing protein [Ideonella sp.]|nr:beta-propeller domain-containing protein [Ideonella sp.]